eukprot:sb/3476600/
MVGNISLEDIKSEEQRLREEHVRFQDQQSQLHSKRQLLQECVWLVRFPLHFCDAIAKRKELEKKEKQIAAKRRLYHNEVQAAFRRAQSQIVYATQARKAEIELDCVYKCKGSVRT